MILGIDFSLNSTGICFLDEQTKMCKTLAIKTTKRVPGKRKGTTKKVQMFGEERLDFIDKASRKVLSAHPISLALIEGYSMGLKGSRPYPIGEGGGLWKLNLYRAGIRFLVVPPLSLKKFAIGKGKGGKDSMFALRVSELWTGKGFGNFNFETDDQIDAKMLSILGYYIENKNISKTKPQLELIVKILECNSGT